jgi:hypothetical protein
MPVSGLANACSVQPTHHLQPAIHARGEEYGEPTEPDGIVPRVPKTKTKGKTYPELDMPDIQSLTDRPSATASSHATTA